MRILSPLPMLIGLLLLSIWALPAHAQGPSGPITRDQVNEVARELYCPTCSGIPVSTCGIQVCEQMREVIAQKLAAGEEKEQIKTYFVEQFGQRVLAKPEQRGINLFLAWLLPGIALMAALATAFIWLRRRVALSAPAPITPLPAAYQERLERELQRLDP